MKQSVVLVGSTGGGVLSRLLQQAFVRDLVKEVVSDRSCGFLAHARQHGLPAVQLDASSGAQFSTRLCEQYPEPQGLMFLSFYTRLFSPSWVRHVQGRMLNFHPSLLPAFPGMNGFADTWASGSQFMGCTVHGVDEGMDTGPILMQAALPLDRRLGQDVNRHRLFLAQVACGLQLLSWWRDGRLQHDGAQGWSLPTACIAFGPFVPSLDRDLLSSCGLQGEFAAAGICGPDTGASLGQSQEPDPPCRPPVRWV